MRACAIVVAGALLFLPGCGESASNMAAPDIGNAASEAQADIDSYAANTAANTFEPPTAPSPVSPGSRSQAITPEQALTNETVVPGNSVTRR